MYQYENDPTHDTFTGLQAPHVLMITNHGVHQWDVVPGLPDTGGQNLFVNMFTNTLAALGFRVTIANRGGYVHPTTGDPQVGLRYKDGRQRIIYLQDGRAEFVRKEDMNDQTPALVEFLWNFLESPAGGYVDIIISHYWDGAKIGTLVRRHFRDKVPHIWVPHSLGMVKKRNMAPDTWADLRIDERIAIERDVIAELDGAAATSPLIRQALIEDYGVEQPLFLPPCIDPTRFHPRQIDKHHEIYEFVGRQCGLSGQQVRQSRIITEISRTDQTKRKDVLIRAFALVLKKHPHALLVVSVDKHEEQLYTELWALVRELGVASHVAVMGNVWKWLPDLYAITDVYCSPSIMEGFGMAVQEAAATKVPVVGSNRIPFVTEYLLNGETQHYTCEDGAPTVKIGKGAIVVEADDVKGFACAIDKLLTDKALHASMGQHAYSTTIPYFTWDEMTRQFLDDIDFGEHARALVAGDRRYHLDRKTLAEMLDSQNVEALSVVQLEDFFRREDQLDEFLPREICRTDPRDGAVIVFHPARARRPHDNPEPPAEVRGSGANDPICRGETSRAIDVAPLSEGFTFINKNRFPVLYPFKNGTSTAVDGNGHAARGMHFLQWTSSYFDRDWHNMPQSDRLVAFRRLAALEGKLLLDESSGYPISGQTAVGQTTYGHVLIMKNFGRLVGGSLAHGHQQIVFSNLMPRHFSHNEEFAKKHGESFASYMLRENPDNLLVKDYGTAVLMVPYFMRRPYNTLLILKDAQKRFLCECEEVELAALAQAWGEVTGAIMAFMPSMGKQTAYNITVSNGPGAGLYCEFLPYTQETGGLEQLGLWVCQDDPHRVATHLREFLAELYGCASLAVNYTVS